MVLSSSTEELLTLMMMLFNKRLKCTYPACPAFMKCLGVIEKKSFTVLFSLERMSEEVLKDISGRSNLCEQRYLM